MNKKPLLHQKNPHVGRYNFDQLIKGTPELAKYIKPNPMGDNTIDFSDSNSVLLLNKALLKQFYLIDYWDIPKGYLCPPIPGRADYIHYAADLIDRAENAKVLDIGTGANCIYPIIGLSSYNWVFRATDIDQEALNNAQKIVKLNKKLTEKIEVVKQENKSFIFKGIIKDDDYFDITMCNPPFHASEKEAIESNRRKIENLNKHRSVKQPMDKSNFGGKKAELWCPGGEMFFIKKMIKESTLFADQVTWFTSLVSKSENVRTLRYFIRKHGATKVKVKEMTQGSKVSRMIAWTFKKTNI